ncbi:hypothetical protein Agub_g15818 [Astrephomene gubernaculifera]|uniref:Uncharacterized protein n=1 Tax=Astrephomene gubernaculifera TaxID=47775 RepID=A0AAD3E562_9CHLO|nr:hypothetical protein Agub_g15818 [Astrephomene gubernaculifera]
MLPFAKVAACVSSAWMAECNDSKIQKAVAFLPQVYGDLIKKGLAAPVGQLDTLMEVIHHDMTREAGGSWDWVRARLAATSHIYSFCEGIPREALAVTGRAVKDSTAFKGCVLVCYQANWSHNSTLHDTLGRSPHPEEVMELEWGFGPMVLLCRLNARQERGKATYPMWVFARYTGESSKRPPMLQNLSDYPDSISKAQWWWQRHTGADLSDFLTDTSLQLRLAVVQNERLTVADLPTALADRYAFYTAQSVPPGLLEWALGLCFANDASSLLDNGVPGSTPKALGRRGKLSRSQRDTARGREASMRKMVEQKRGEFSNASVQFILIEDRGAKVPVAYAAYRPDLDDAKLVLRLSEVRVEERAQRDGIGSGLVRGLVRFAERLQLAAVVVTVAADNAGGKRFFEAIGFVTHEGTSKATKRETCLVLSIQPLSFNRTMEPVQRYSLDEVREMERAASRLRPAAGAGWIKLGAGGFGSVTAGVTASARRVAIKRFTLGPSTSTDVLRAIRQNITVGMTCCSENLLQLVGIAHSPAGSVTGLVWEEATHGSLEPPGPNLPLQQVVGLLADAANGAAVLHDAGLVHRDIKPANILVTDRGHGVVGLLADYDVTVESGTRFGLVGTPGYRPPEAEGQPDPQATTTYHTLAFDVYSFGATLATVLFRTSAVGPTVCAVQTQLVAECRSLVEEVQNAWAEGAVMPSFEVVRRLLDLAAAALVKTPGGRLQHACGPNSNKAAGDYMRFIAIRLRELASGLTR